MLQLPINGKCQSRHEVLLRTLQSSEPCSMVPLGLFALTDRVKVMVTCIYSVYAWADVGKCLNTHHYPKPRSCIQIF